MDESDEYVGEDGYPTEECLDTIRKWDPRDFKGLIELLHEVWAYAPSAIRERGGGDLVLISTYGWSGNEDIMAAIQDNFMWWSFHWHSARRGGHYRFVASPYDYDKEKRDG